MLLVENINKFNDNNIYFNDPVENNIMENSVFSKIIYSNESYTVNGIYLDLNLRDIKIEQINNKFKCKFDVNSNKGLINKVAEVENKILNCYSSKINVLSISRFLNTGLLKNYFDTNVNIKAMKFVLKISGIWERPKDVGLTFKILTVIPQS